MASSTDTTELDDQDQSEAFDEDNTNLDEHRYLGEDRESAEELPSVYDVTSAVGDDDDDDAEIGDDMDDDDIVQSELDQNADEDDAEDDDLFDRDAAAYDGQADPTDLTDDADADTVDATSADEVELVYAGDLNNVMGAGSSARDMESDTLSDSDLKELHYKE